MNHEARCNGLKVGSKRSGRAMGAALALLLVVTGLATGCGDELEREFRSAAVGSIESGVNAVVDGLLDGVFAIADPDEGDAAATGTTAATGAAATGS